MEPLMKGSIQTKSKFYLLVLLSVSAGTNNKATTRTHFSDQREQSTSYLPKCITMPKVKKKKKTFIYLTYHFFPYLKCPLVWKFKTNKETKNFPSRYIELIKKNKK